MSCCVKCSYKSPGFSWVWLHTLACLKGHRKCLEDTVYFLAIEQGRIRLLFWKVGDVCEFSKTSLGSMKSWLNKTHGVLLVSANDIGWLRSAIIFFCNTFTIKNEKLNWSNNVIQKLPMCFECTFSLSKEIQCFFLTKSAMHLYYFEGSEWGVSTDGINQCRLLKWCMPVCPTIIHKELIDLSHHYFTDMLVISLGSKFIKENWDTCCSRVFLMDQCWIPDCWIPGISVPVKFTGKKP